MRQRQFYVAVWKAPACFAVLLLPTLAAGQVTIGLRANDQVETLSWTEGEADTANVVFNGDQKNNELFIQSVDEGGYRIGFRSNGVDYHLRVKPSKTNVRTGEFQRTDEYDTFHFYPLGDLKNGGIRCKIWTESQGVRFYLCFRYTSGEHNDAIFRSGFDGGVFRVSGFRCEPPPAGWPTPVYAFTKKSPYDCFAYSLNNSNADDWRPRGAAFYAHRERLSEMTPVYQYEYNDPDSNRHFYSTNHRLHETDPTLQEPLLLFYAYNKSTAKKWAKPVYHYTSQQPNRSMLSVAPDLEIAGWKNEGVLFKAMPPSSVNWKLKITGSNKVTNSALTKNEILAALEVQNFTGEIYDPESDDQQAEAVHAVIHGPFAGPFPAPRLISTPAPRLYGYAKKRPGTFAVYQYDYRGSNSGQFFYSMDPNLAQEDTAFGEPHILFYAYSRKTDKEWTVPVFHYVRNYDSFLRANPSRELESLRYVNQGLLFRSPPNIDTLWNIELQAANKSTGDALSTEQLAAALRAEGFTGKIADEQPTAERLRVSVDGALFGPYNIQAGSASD